MAKQRAKGKLIDVITCDADVAKTGVPPKGKDFFVTCKSPYSQCMKVRVYTDKHGITTKHWYTCYEYQVENYRIQQRKLRIAPTDTMPFIEACKFNDYNMQQFKKGIDPVAHNQKLLREAAARPKEMTMKELFVKYLAEYAEINTAKSTYKQTVCKINKHLSVLNDIEVAHLSARRVLELRDNLYKNATPTVSNHCLATVKKILNWAVEQLIIEVNVTLPIKKRHKDKHREEFFSVQELYSIFTKLKDGGNSMTDNPQRIIKLLAGTGMRVSEVTNLSIDEIIEGDNGEMALQLPPERTKTNSPLAVYLIPEFAQLVRDAIAEKREPRSKFVFESRKESCRFKAVTSNSISGRFKPMILKLGMSDRLVLHSLRDSFVNHATLLGFDSDVADRCLNHKTGSAIKHVYLHTKNLSELKEVWVGVQQWLLQVESGEIKEHKQNVISLFDAPQSRVSKSTIKNDEQLEVRQNGHLR